MRNSNLNSLWALGIVSVAAAIACQAAPPALVAPSNFDANHPDASGMKLTFDDEFNTLSASPHYSDKTTRWSNTVWWKGPARETYVPEAVSVQDGKAVLKCSNDSGWKCGYLGTYFVNVTGAGFLQKYGYFEARLKLPGGKGAWPAWWLAGVGDDKHTEIDIVEAQGSKPSRWYTTLHDDTKYRNVTNTQTVGPKSVIHDLDFDMSQDYHRYGVLWAPNSPTITFYLDGKPVQTVPKFASTDSEPMMLLLGQQMGDIGYKGNEIDDSTENPSLMYADYVRVWQFPGQQNFGSCIGDCGR